MLVKRYHTVLFYMSLEINSHSNQVSTKNYYDLMQMIVPDLIGGSIPSHAVKHMQQLLMQLTFNQ